MVFKDVESMNSANAILTNELQSTASCKFLWSYLIMLLMGIRNIFSYFYCLPFWKLTNVINDHSRKLRQFKEKEVLKSPEKILLDFRIYETFCISIYVSMYDLSENQNIIFEPCFFPQQCFVKNTFYSKPSVMPNNIFNQPSLFEYQSFSVFCKHEYMTIIFLYIFVYLCSHFFS